MGDVTLPAALVWGIALFVLSGSVGLLTWLVKQIARIREDSVKTAGILNLVEKEQTEHDHRIARLEGWRDGLRDAQSPS